MKNGQVSPNDARDTSDSSMVCGYIQGTDGGSSGGTQSGKTTRYWDCCKVQLSLTLLCLTVQSLFDTY